MTSAVQPRQATSPGTVPKEWVHKSNHAEVLLTDWRPAGDDTAVVTARWPGDHPFYLSHHGLYDPLLLVETIRQTVPLLSHAAYGIPFDHRLGWDSFRLDLVPAALRITEEPAEPLLQVTRTLTRRRALGSARHHTRITATLGGNHLATADLSFTNFPPAVYRRLRGPYADPLQALSRALPPSPPVPASRVERHRPDDVLLSPTGAPDQWLLRVDPAHPILFDHPLDHIPGMLILEAARQATHAARPGPVLLTGINAAFHRYAELDRPCLLHTRSAPPGLHLTAQQDGRKVFTATVTTDTPH
ncbi:MAG TPA: ScbA/BarX family gamma-butyrolactone biosynthesis protein [Streptomyces sp.]|nr:ScbA/BarX family gamma-butyrolactone biosynthesis protein [Streptomyces sp.]